MQNIRFQVSQNSLEMRLVKLSKNLFTLSLVKNIKPKPKSKFKDKWPNDARYSSWLQRGQTNVEAKCVLWFFNIWSFNYGWVMVLQIAVSEIKKQDD